MRQLFNLTSYVTFLSRNKVYTAINVFGLSISLMFVLLIGVYTWQEKSIDRQHSKSSRIYLVGTDFYKDRGRVLGSHHAVLKYLRNRYPEIENTCGFIKGSMRLKGRGGFFYRAIILETDSTFFSMFDFPLLQGDRQTCLKDKNNAVVTQRFARRYFGTDQVMGREIVWNDSTRFRVTGVVQNFDNTIINDDVDIITDFSWGKYDNVANMDEYFPKWVNMTGASVFVQVRQGTEMQGREEELTKFFHSFWPFFNDKTFPCKVILIPLNELYFSGLESINENLRTGNEKLVNILFTVGLVILLFSIMNYINLTVAQSGYRSREVATRRLFGATRGNVILRLVMESTVLCLLSLLIAIALTLAFAPTVGQLLGVSMKMEVLSHPATILLLIFSTLLVGFLSGIIPAVILSKARPIEVVRGTFRRQIKMILSKTFITFQNFITIVMLASAIIMSLQMQHLIKAPLGFNTKHLICISQGEAFASPKFPVFLDRLRQLPAVSMVIPSMGTPQDGGNNNTVIEKNKKASFQMLIGEPGFMEIYGLTLADNRRVPHCPVVYLNRQALYDLEMKPTDVRMSKYYKEKNFYCFPPDAAFGGIVNGFRLRNIMEMDNLPILVCIKDKIENPWDLTIQVKGDLVNTYREIQRIYKEIYREDLVESHPYVDKQIEQAFEQDLKISRIVSVFAFIAILISLLGLVAMSTYFIQQRSKEIAMRKVFGSTSNQIRRSLIRTFLHYVFIAFAISVPTIWYFMSSWISQYTYRITWWPWIIVAGIIVLIISFSAVAVQSYMASNENPVKHIKQE